MTTLRLRRLPEVQDSELVDLERRIRRLALRYPRPARVALYEALSRSQAHVLTLLTAEAEGDSDAR